MDINEIRRILSKNKNSFKARYKIRQLGIFGSFVRGEQKRQSDVDILVSFSTSPGLFDFLKAENEMKRLLNRKVDLVMKESLKPAIGKRVLREVIYI